jgi:CheY-like chemotaxis protein
LIAEDSSVSEPYPQNFEPQKYKILLAKNGGEVLKQLEVHIDCVLMDINIPAACSAPRNPGPIPTPKSTPRSIIAINGKR